MKSLPYYTDVNGKVCKVSDIPECYRTEVKHHKTFSEIWLISKETNEVFEEYVLWESIKTLQEAGIECDSLLVLS